MTCGVILPSALLLADKIVISIEASCGGNHCSLYKIRNN